MTALSMWYLPYLNQALRDEDETDFNIHQEEDPEDFDAGADEPDNDGDEFEEHKEQISDNAPLLRKKIKSIIRKWLAHRKKRILQRTFTEVSYTI